MNAVWCSQCKQDRPADKFLTIKKRGYKVTKCNDCVAHNMRLYWRRVETDIEKVRRGGNDE